MGRWHFRGNGFLHFLAQFMELGKPFSPLLFSQIGSHSLIILLNCFTSYDGGSVLGFLYSSFNTINTSPLALIFHVIHCYRSGYLNYILFTCAVAVHGLVMFYGCVSHGSLLKKLGRKYNWKGRFSPL